MPRCESHEEIKSILDKMDEKLDSIADMKKLRVASEQIGKEVCLIISNLMEEDFRSFQTKDAFRRVREIARACEDYIDVEMNLTAAVVLSGIALEKHEEGEA